MKFMVIESNVAIVAICEIWASTGTKENMNGT